MKVLLKKIHHLIRYFLAFGIVAFVGFVKQIQDKIFLLFIGPPLYIAETLKSFIDKNVTRLPSTNAVNHYAFLLPVCLLYFGFIGFQLKQLWNERGKVRIVIMVSFIGFLIFIHHFAAKNLALYLISE